MKFYSNKIIERNANKGENKLKNVKLWKSSLVVVVVFAMLLTSAVGVFAAGFGDVTAVREGNNVNVTWTGDSPAATTFMMFEVDLAAFADEVFDDNEHDPIVYVNQLVRDGSHTILSNVVVTESHGRDARFIVRVGGFANQPVGFAFVDFLNAPQAFAVNPVSLSWAEGTAAPGPARTLADGVVGGTGDYTFTVLANMPSWLAVNENTGAVTVIDGGVPAYVEGGVNMGTFTVEVDDGDAAPQTMTVTWTITEAPAFLRGSVLGGDEVTANDWLRLRLHIIYEATEGASGEPLPYGANAAVVLGGDEVVANDWLRLRLHLIYIATEGESGEHLPPWAGDGDGPPLHPSLIPNW